MAGVIGKREILGTDAELPAFALAFLCPKNKLKIICRTAKCRVEFSHGQAITQAQNRKNLMTKKITIKAATKAGKEAHAAYLKNPLISMDHHAFVALRGSGFDIKAGAYADGDDCRTIKNLAKWIRHNAVTE